MTKRYALQHKEGERSGDFVIRAGYIAPIVSDLTWHDRAGDEGVHRGVSVTAREIPSYIRESTVWVQSMSAE